MLELKTKLDRLEAATSYNFINYKSHDLEESEMRELVEAAILEVREPRDHEPHSKESSLYMFRLYRTVPDIYSHYNENDYEETLYNVFDVLCQEVKYGLRFSLSYDEITFLLKSLKKL